MLTEDDLTSATIVGCPQVSPGLTPCTKVQKIIFGKAEGIKVDGEVPLLEVLVAFTNGVPPGIVVLVGNLKSNAVVYGLGPGATQGAINAASMLSRYLHEQRKKRRRKWWVSLLGVFFPGLKHCAPNTPFNLKVKELLFGKIYPSLDKTDYPAPDEENKIQRVKDRIDELKRKELKEPTKDEAWKTKTPKQRREELVKFQQKQWEGMGKDKRKEFLQKVANIFAEEYGLKIPTKGDTTVFGTILDTTTNDVYEEFRHSTPDCIYINEGFLDPNAKGTLAELADAIETVCHEGTHRYQYFLMYVWAIIRGDLEYDQKRFMEANEWYYFAPGLEGKLPGWTPSPDETVGDMLNNYYKEQPQEAHAFYVGARCADP